LKNEDRPYFNSKQNLLDTDLQPTRHGDGKAIKGVWEADQQLAPRHLHCFLIGSTSGLELLNAHREVSPVSREVMLSRRATHLYLARLQGSIRFFAIRYPHRPSIRLTVIFPLQGAIRAYPVSTEMTRFDSLGAPYTPAVDVCP